MIVQWSSDAIHRAKRWTQHFIKGIPQ